MRPIISADSHITEPANTYVDHIDAKWREKAPRMRYHESLGDAFFVEGLPPPASRPRRSAPPACASKTCTAAAGIRTRAWRSRTATASTPR